MQKSPLFSVCIVCYRTFDYIFSAIDSVLEQNYPQVELVVSDDGSDNFPRQQITEYIERNKRSNMKQVLIRQEAENVGTVKNLNHAILASTGEYICFLAADDALHDEHVLECYAQCFDEAAPDCYIAMAQAGMYDNTLEHLDYYFVPPQIENLLKKNYLYQDETCRLLGMMSLIPFLPSVSTVFKREFFDLFGLFDETYVLIEDFPMHWRLIRDGWKLYYKSFVAVKHRDGGISHGNSKGLSRSRKLYFQDASTLQNHVIMQDLGLLNPDFRNRFLWKRSQEKRYVDYQSMVLGRGLPGYIHFAVKYPVWTLKTALKLLHPFFQLIQWNVMVLGFLLMAGAPCWADIWQKIAHALGLLPIADMAKPIHNLRNAGLLLFSIGCVIVLLWGISCAVIQIEGMPHYQFKVKGDH